MGTYLSKPITEKCQESGGDDDESDDDNCHSKDDNVATTTSNNPRRRRVRPVKWGIVDMQGWRKSMEDSHIAVSKIPVPVTLSNDSSENNSSTKANTTNAKVFGVFDGHGGPEVARFCSLYLISVLKQQQSWNVVARKDATENNDNNNVNNDCYDNDDALLNKIDNDNHNNGIGQALISAFHALDRMIDDPDRRYVLRVHTHTVTLMYMCRLRVFVSFY